MSEFGINTNWIRDQRSIYGGFDLELNLEVTVFLGLYNGRDYLTERIRDLQKQDSQDFYILIADNNSESFDLTDVLSSLQSIEQFSKRWMLVRNPVNLGGLGSFQLNLDLVPTLWITFVHQDDSYLPRHVSTHIKAIKEGEQLVSSVSTDLGTLTAQGKATSVPPRSNWFIDDSYPEGVFVANVSEQVIPFPALSVKKCYLELNRVPWHTVAFSDSELTLFLLMTGSHRFIQQETVLYRESPTSESHSQGQSVRIFSATLGLLRVFSSQEFVNYVSNIEETMRQRFLSALKEALANRIPHLPYQELVWAMALEKVSHAWAYREPSSTNATKVLFEVLGESYTPSLLSSILQFGLKDPRSQSQELVPDSQIDFSNLKVTTSKSISVFKRTKSTLKFVFFYVIGLLPYSARKKLHQKIKSFSEKRKFSFPRSPIDRGKSE